MVDDFLDSSKLKAQTLRIDRCARTAQEIISPALPILETRAAQKQISIVTDVSPGLPQVFADAEKASRVVLNLAMNAIGIQVGKQYDAPRHGSEANCFRLGLFVH